MSTSLVRKGLELFADECEDNRSLKKKRKGGPSSSRREDLMKVISTNKKGVRKQLSKLTHVERRRPTAKEGKLKSSVDKYLKSQPSDCTEANVQLLLSLSTSTPSTSSTYSKILKHSRSRRTNDLEQQQEKEEKQTAFTEEDFIQFEKEYMPMRIDPF